MGSVILKVGMLGFGDTSMAAILVEPLRYCLEAIKFFRLMVGFDCFDSYHPFFWLESFGEDPTIPNPTSKIFQDSSR